MRRLPLATVALVVAILAASLSSVAQAALQFDRSLILDGQELWRAVTGQLVHGTPRLLAVDLASTAVLMWLIERRRGSVAASGVVLAAAIATGLGTLWFRPDIRFLEGASGIASGLFAYLVLDLLTDGGSRQRRFALVAGAAFTAKLVVESGADTLAPWWMESASQAQVVGTAHVSGAVAGIVLCGAAATARTWRYP